MSRSMAVWAAAVAGALVGAGADGTATGVAGADVLLRAGLGVLVVLAASTAPRGVLLCATALATSAASSVAPWQLVGGAACALAAASCVPTERRPDLGAATGVLLYATILHLGWPETSLATAGVAASIVAALLAAALLAVGPVVRRRAALAAVAALGCCVVASIGYGVAASPVRARVERTIDELELALSAAESGESVVAAAQLERVEAELAVIEGRLDVWWALPARAVPVVGVHATAVDAVLGSAREVALSARDAALAVDQDELRPRDGAVDLEAVDRLRQPLDRVADELSTTAALLGRISSPWLVAPVADRLAELDTRVDDATVQVDRARRTASFVHDLLGGEEPRTWFLLLVTTSELRGSGGFPGNYGILTSDDGRLELEHVGRIQEVVGAITDAGVPTLGDPEYLARYQALWQLDRYFQNVTVSPHFPSVAESVARRYEAATARPIDGVLSLDPYAFAALLELTGPVTVDGWPEPLSAANAAQVLLHDEYVALDIPARADLLGNAAATLFDRLTSGGFPAPADAAPVLSAAIAAKHIQLWSSRDAEEGWFDEIAAGGAMRPVRGDAIGVVVNDANENKIGWFLGRSTSYDVVVDPDTGQSTATLEVTLRNDAPATGLPVAVIGQVRPELAPAGHNRSVVTVYSPLELDEATIDGDRVEVTSGTERRRNTYELFVTAPPGGSATLRMVLRGRLALPGGDYVLDVHHQPGVRDDRLAVTVRAGEATAGRPDGPIGRDETINLSLR